MKKFRWVLFGFVLLLPGLATGQCPEKQWLWERLQYLKGAREYTPEQILTELTGYENLRKPCAWPADSVYAFLLQRLGGASYGTGNYLAAIDYTQRSVRVLTSLQKNTPVTDGMLAKGYANLAVFYGKLRLTGQRVAAMDSCLSVSTQRQIINEDFLYVLTQRVDYLLAVGDYANCYAYASTGELYAGRYPDAERRKQYLFSFLGYKVNALLQQKQYDAADEFLKTKIAEFKEKDIQLYLGSLYELQAEVHIQQKKFAAARALFQTALMFEHKAGHRSGYLQTMNNLGFYYYAQHLNDADKALQTYKAALRYAGDDTDPAVVMERLNILANIANVFRKKEAFDSAFSYYRLAFAQLRPGLDENGLLDASAAPLIAGKNLSYVSSLITDKGDAYFEKFKKEAKPADGERALQVYKAAVRLLERSKTEQTSLDSKLFWRKESRRLFDHAVALCYQTGRTADAFYFFEKSRAVLLQDQLNELASLPGAEIVRQTEVKSRILQNQWALNDPATDSATRNQLRQALFADQVVLNGLTAAIKAEHPLYFQSFVDSSFVSLADLGKSLLRTHRLLVELFEGEDAVYLLLALRDTVHFRKIDKDTYQKTVALYTTYLRDGSRLNRERPLFLKTANDLFNLLFGDLRLPAGRMIVSPDVTYFPFEALVEALGPTPSYLVERYAVSYAYSARFLLTDFGANGGKATGDFLGVAPLRYPPDWRLASLTGSDESLHRIAGHFDEPVTQVGPAAARTAFLKTFYNYRIVQLYTHASDSGSKGEPVIFFADSALSFSEVMPEGKPVTGLVVLSACKTALGKMNTGEGMFGFNRAFAGLGIPASVSNLWVADDRATYRLTELFYQKLAEGLPTDVALQEAKKDFVRSAPNDRQTLPYYWAGTILAGKTERPLFNEKARWTKWLWAVPLVLLSVFFFARRRTVRHKI